MGNEIAIPKLVRKIRSHTTVDFIISKNEKYHLRSRNKSYKGENPIYA